MSKFYFTALILTGMLLNACETIKKDPVFDIVPHIELVDITPDTVREFQDSLLLTIAYEDGDGDLGYASSDSNCIYIQDARLTLPDEYYVGPLAPLGDKISIQGRLTIQVSGTFVFGNGKSETTWYEVFIRDRKGNQSNTIQTPKITIVKP